ncbi:DNA adenine methylase [Gemmatimonas sp.]
MPSSFTPLRYPGGKTKMSAFLAAVMRVNRFVGRAYAEPFAGGAGAGLSLLYEGWSSHFFLNDIDRGVVSFWRAAIGHSESFARQIEKVPLTVREWEHQRSVYKEAPMGKDLGFATFYLNRTNRSGIMNGGLIGGRDQRGAYKMDARFNRIDLAKRVRTLGRFRRQITVSRLDALEFLMSLDVATPTFTYLDPPYYVKGQDLYMNFYSPDDHAQIANELGSFSHPWIMTYDACEEIRCLYRQRIVRQSELSYSAREVRRGEELVIFGPRVRPPAPHQLPSGARTRGFQLI